MTLTIETKQESVVVPAVPEVLPGDRRTYYNWCGNICPNTTCWINYYYYTVSNVLSNVRYKIVVKESPV